MSPIHWPKAGLCAACGGDYLIWRNRPDQRFCSRSCPGRTLPTVTCARPDCDERFRQRTDEERYEERRRLAEDLEVVAEAL